jgi:hypothetical protein
VAAHTSIRRFAGAQSARLAKRKFAYFATAVATDWGIGGTPSTTTFEGTGTVPSCACRTQEAATTAAQTKCLIERPSEKPGS